MARGHFPALTFFVVLAALAAPAQAQRGTDRGGVPVNASGNPSALITADAALSHVARDKGDRNALEDSADAAAELFTPARTPANDALRLIAKKASPRTWQTEAAWISCDGSAGVTRGTWHQDAASGWYIRVWRRQKKGAYKWLLELDAPLANAPDAPEWIEGKVADCPARPPRAPDSPATPKSGAPVATQWPLAGPIPPGNAAAGADSRDARANDGSLGWRSAVSADGTRTFVVWLWKDGAMREVANLTARTH